MSATDRGAGLPVLLLYNIDETWEPADIAQVLGQVDEVTTALSAQGHPVRTLPIRDSNLAERLQGFDPARYVVLNWCEELPGVPYSDAQVAYVLEALRYTYTGPTGDVLKLSWDKAGVKHLLNQHGLTTPCWRVYEDAQAAGWSCFPAIVKPAHEHCSLGVTPESVVLDPEQLRRRIAYVLQTFHQPALVEDFIDGREFHVSLWGNGHVRMLPPAEMDFSAFDDVHDRLCTYEDKFDIDSHHCTAIRVRVPAPLSSEEYRALEETALGAYHALGCRDYARLDIRLRNGTFYVLDVNPNPDIGSDTSTASAAEAAGLTYGAWISDLISLAAQRHRVYGARRH